VEVVVDVATMHPVVEWVEEGGVVVEVKVRSSNHPVLRQQLDGVVEVSWGAVVAVLGSVLAVVGLGALHSTEQLRGCQAKIVPRLIRPGSVT
jgi:hypothetical protein